MTDQGGLGVLSDAEAASGVGRFRVSDFGASERTGLVPLMGLQDDILVSGVSITTSSRAANFGQRI